jgi:hypothetical protein
MDNGLIIAATGSKHVPQPPQRSRTLSGNRARRTMPTPPQHANEARDEVAAEWVLNHQALGLAS